MKTPKKRTGRATHQTKTEVQADAAQFDAVDRRIVELLKTDGRMLNRDIAEALGINPVTVASRIERMEKARLLRTVAIADFAAFGLDLLLTIGVEVQNRRAADVAHDLARLPEVFSVQEVTGARDIEMLVAVTDIAALRDFMLRLGAIPGIRSLDTGIAIDVVKYSPDMAPLR
jgi:DNA-binding Lrp family transcriptional regulator